MRRKHKEASCKFQFYVIRLGFGACLDVSVVTDKTSSVSQLDSIVLILC